MRLVFLDIETTGLSFLKGDKVFEIGCIEMINRVKTGNNFHCYIDPEVPLSDASKQICKIDDEALIGKKKFYEIAEGFLEYIDRYDDLIILAHNAKFDIGFLNHYLSFYKFKNLSEYKIVDTLKIARSKYAGSQAGLDALAKKFNIDLSLREKNGHGAITDANILSEVFLKMCEYDKDEDIAGYIKDDELFFGINKMKDTLEQRFFNITEFENEAHLNLLEKLKSIKW